MKRLETSMKNKEIIQAIAELDGWKQSMQDKESLKAWSEVYGEHYIDDEEYHGVPPYLSSRDAIVPVIEKQEFATQVNIAAYLCIGITPAQSPRIVTMLATPRQLCEALLRATGKWIE